MVETPGDILGQTHDPFGNILAEEKTFSQPFRFVGQFGVMTEPSGFYYMRARYYDPGVGREQEGRC
jgi:RHS repeat-associated protein